MVMVVNAASLTSILVTETLTVALYQAAAAVNRSSATGCDCRTQMGRAASGERAYGSFLWAAQGGPPQPPNLLTTVATEPWREKATPPMS